MKPISKTAIIEDDTQVIEVKCPLCRTRNLVERQGQYGTFYGCAGFPRCRQKAISPAQYEKIRKAQLENPIEPETTTPKFKPTEE